MISTAVAAGDSLPGRKGVDIVRRVCFPEGGASAAEELRGPRGPRRRPVAARASTDSPHYQIHLVDQAGTDYRVAVNVQSQQAPSELLYLADEDFRHPVTAGARRPPDRLDGPAVPSPVRAALDFIRGNLFDRAAMRPLPADAARARTTTWPTSSTTTSSARSPTPPRGVYAFGQRWGPETGTPDKVFGFRPGNGVHDIHMNQGNSGQFRRDDGVWQDGGLLLHFPAAAHWVAIFLAFQSQAWHTDDTTGHTLPDTPRRPAPRRRAPLRIVAALVNPAGPARSRDGHAAERLSRPGRPRGLVAGRQAEEPFSPAGRPAGFRRHPRARHRFPVRAG